MSDRARGFQRIRSPDEESPSAAATVVAAGNRNGRLTWKTEARGETYADWHDAKLAVVVGTGDDD